MQTDETKYGQARNRIRALQAHPAMRDACKTMSMWEHIKFRCAKPRYALRWPTCVMDVMPVVERKNIEKLLDRLQRAYAERGIEFGLRECSTATLGAFTERMKNKLRAKLTVCKENFLDVTFDGRQYCDLVDDADSIHLNDLIHEFGWQASVQDLLDGDYNAAALVSYEALVDVIGEGRSGRLVINDPSLERVSYFFMRLGRSLVAHVLSMRFVEPPAEMERAPRIHQLPRSELIAVQAIYFGHFHTFHRRNIATTSSSFPPQTFADSCGSVSVEVKSNLYEKFEKIFNEVVSQAQAAVAPATANEIAALSREYQERLGRAQAAEESRPECVVVVAPAGSGKSTLIRNKFPNHKLIAHDEKLSWIRLSGHTLAELRQTFKDKINCAVEQMQFGFPKLERALKSTLFYRCHGILIIEFSSLSSKLFEYIEKSIESIKQNFVVESVGRLTNSFNPYAISKVFDVHMKPTGFLPENNFYALHCEDFKMKAIFVYASLRVQYNQQLRRLLVEHRFTGFEWCKKHNFAIWKNLLPEWRGCTEVYAVTDSEELLPIFVGGQLKRENFEVIAQSKLDKMFVEFLCSLANIDLFCEYPLRLVEFQV